VPSRWGHALRAKLRAILRSTKVEEDLHDELSFHLAMQEQSNQQSGLDPREAARRARVSFGGVEAAKERSRDARPLRWARTLTQDLRHASRSLRRSPGFTITAVLSLGIGIGASAAMFSLVDQVLLRLLPVKAPERLVLIDWRGPQFAAGRGSGNLLSYPLCRDLQAQTQFFDGVFCRHPTRVTLVMGGQPQPEAAEMVSGTYFPVLGVRPALGRLIVPSDDVDPGAHPVVVLSYDYWRTKLGAAPDVVGRTVLVNTHPMTVVGVAEATFHGVDLGEVPALWIPASMVQQAMLWDPLRDRRARWMHVFGRLRPGITADEARVGLQPWFTQMLQSDVTLEGFPKITPSQRAAFLASTIAVTPASQGRSNLRNTLGGPLWVLMAGTLLLYLLASANVASLFLARATARVREIQTRIALGASRGRVTALLVVDGLLIALYGGLLGLLMAPVVSNVLLSFLPQDVAGVDLTSRVDRRVFAFVFLASVVTGALSGLGLVWQAGRIPLMSSLKERSGNNAGGVRLRKALVMGQMAFALVLLVGAGLFVQTLARLHATGSGISTTHLLTFGINLTSTGYTPARQEQLGRTLFTALRELPDVESAAISGFRLLDGGSWNGQMTIEADTRTTTDRVVHFNPISPGFFTTVGARIVAGRDFDDRDSRSLTEEEMRAAIVNERFARRYFGDRNPVGRRLGLGANADTPTNIEIVGVVKDFSYRNLREETEQVFFSLFQGTGFGGGWFYLKVRGRPESAIASVRSAVDTIDPALPLLAPRSFDEQMNRALTTERMLATLSTGFGVIALLLSAVGLYGVMSFVVTSRTLEIGIRLALGATRASAVRHIMRDAAIMVGVGTAIALPCIWALSRLVRAQLFGVDAIDPPTIAAAGAVLALVATAGAMLPAWRAASVKPTEALRAE
jgi:predicted permease